MKATELASKCENIAKNYKTVYMWGVFGSLVTESIIQQKTKQYPSFYTASKQSELRALIGKGVWAFDCVNMIKGVLWGWNANTSKTYGGAVYASNGVPDVNADTFFSKCTNQSADFSNIQVGEAVWMSGHIGVYLGNGLVVECTPIWANGVQITACGNIGSKAGYNTRKWTKHGKIPYVTYDGKVDTPTQPAAGKRKVGDVVSFNGVYTSSSSTTKLKPAVTKGTITKIIAGARNPYLIDNGNIGWVNDSVITSGASSVAYFKAFNSASIVSGLNSIGVDSSFSYRTKIANANGIANYKGTASQNTQLCDLARKGKLIKP